MPRRLTPLVNGEYYHVFNRGVNKQPIFNNRFHFSRALETIKFYLIVDPPVRYSKFSVLPKKERENFLKNIYKKEKFVDLISYCLMPNHFHILLKQNLDEGTSEFVRRFQISYTRYFNTKHERIGPLLQGQFKAVRIEDDEQLLQVHRYIHLNPYTSIITNSLKDLENYEWSSLPEYLGKTDKGMCKKDLVLANFKNSVKYKEFIFNHAEYQRKLERIRHLLLE